MTAAAVEEPTDMLSCGCNRFAGERCPEGDRLWAEHARAWNRRGELMRAGISIFGDQAGIDADHAVSVAWHAYVVHTTGVDEDIPDLRKRVLL
jgi:hypothetical protein